MNIASILQVQSRRRPSQAAIVERVGGREVVLTYGELEERSARGAAGLLGLGLVPGDRVLVFVPMSGELYVVLAALFRAGLVAMFLDPSAGRAHVEHGCRIGEPKAFVAIRKAHLLRLTSGAIRGIPRAISVGGWVPFARRWESLMGGTLAGGEIFAAGAEVPALITFTSGSTGVPKAAVRTHGFLTAQHAALGQAIDLRGGEVDLGTLPIFTLANLASGLTTVIPAGDLRRPAEVEAGPIVEQVRRHRVTRCTASPAFFARLAGHCEATNARLESLRQAYTGGAPVFPALMDRVKAVAPACEVIAVYGSTEAEPIAHVALSQISAEDRGRMLSGHGLLAGPIEPTLQLRILRHAWGTPFGPRDVPLSTEAFDAMRLNAGEAGEIVVAGAHVLSGYLHGHGDETTKIHVMTEGVRTIWHRTGDAGYLDERGRLWLLGRAEARIMEAKGELYPFAVEAAASGLAGITRTALVAHEGKRLLVVEGIADEAAIRKTLGWAQLDRIVRVERIPLDARHNAKVAYPALRRMLAG